MKIGELNKRCGNCKLIDFCTEPFETPQLCAYEELEDIEEAEYKRIAENVTEEEIEDKLRQYEENNVSPWDDERNGTICDIVLEKLYKHVKEMSRVLPYNAKQWEIPLLLDGRKTVIRRLVKLPNYIKRQEDGGYTLYADGTCYENQCFEQIISYLKKPCQPRDILYVRETWCNANKEGAEPDYYYYADVNKCEDYYKTEWKWRPSIHMPKEAARIWLKVTDVRVERLQDMTEQQADAEGIHRDDCPAGYTWKPETDIHNCYTNPVSAMAALWNATLPKDQKELYGWAANPWVWVIKFERCGKPENEEMI